MNKLPSPAIDCLLKYLDEFDLKNVYQFNKGLVNEWVFRTQPVAEILFMACKMQRRLNRIHRLRHFSLDFLHCSFCLDPVLYSEKMRCNRCQRNVCPECSADSGKLVGSYQNPEYLCEICLVKNK